MDSKINVKNDSKQLLIITITTVIIIVIIFAGVTYAFFTANNPEGSTAQIISENGRMLITYDDGTDNIVPVKDIQPSNTILVNKTFTLTGSNTTVGMNSNDGLDMSYNVGVEYLSTFSDGMIHYYIKEIERPTNSNVTTEYTGETDKTVQGNDTYTGYSHGTFKYGNRYIEMVSGKFPASLNDQTIKFNLIIQFPDNNENQDSEKGKTFNGKIIINNENNKITQVIADLYDSTEKDENGITIDGLQKDGTGEYNIKNLSTTNKKYKVNLLNNSIAGTNTDIYDNLRYVGANPNNYITFNEETWRIIGIFNVYNVETNKYENLAKIIRNDKIIVCAWDTSASGINNAWGINEWNQADLMYELNCDGSNDSTYCREDITNGYLSNLTTGTTKWYSYNNNGRSANYDYKNNIKSNYINKIAKVKWTLGGYLNSSNSALNMYNAERGTAHINNPPDGIPRKDYWEGKIALMYPSDYGFASSDSLCRENLENCADNKANNWLFNNNSDWTLTSLSNNSYYTFYINTDGGLTSYFSGLSYAVRPVLFLKSDVTISSGNGTIDNPYVIN